MSTQRVHQVYITEEQHSFMIESELSLNLFQNNYKTLLMVNTLHVPILFCRYLTLFRIHQFQHQQVKLNVKSVFVYVLFYLVFSNVH
jgi:hypothetical protein